MSLIFYLHKANTMKITFTNTEFKALTPNFIFWCTSEIWYQCVGGWMYLYVEHPYDCTGMCPVYARSETRALDAFLYYFLPWHRSHTGKLTFDLGCLVEATWRSASLWPHITGVTCTYFAILFMWVWRSELRSSCPHVCRTSLPTMGPFPQSCLVDFHTGTFATTFILTCVSSLFSFMLGLCFR